MRPVSCLRYQLFHRTVAAIHGAERYRAPTALLLVHSFSPAEARSGWADFAAFVRAIGLDDWPRAGEVLGPKAWLKRPYDFCGRCSKKVKSQKPPSTSWRRM